MEKEQYKFWIVWNPFGLNPKFKHMDKESAIAEAERLAKQSYSNEFIVMEAIVLKKSGERPVLTTEFNSLEPKPQMIQSNDEIPF